MLTRQPQWKPVLLHQLYRAGMQPDRWLEFTKGKPNWNWKQQYLLFSGGFFPAFNGQLNFNIAFIFKMPLPISGVHHPYSRWLNRMIGMLQVDIHYYDGIFEFSFLFLNHVYEWLLTCRLENHAIKASSSYRVSPGISKSDWLWGLLERICLISWTAQHGVLCANC